MAGSPARGPGRGCCTPVTLLADAPGPPSTRTPRSRRLRGVSQQAWQSQEYSQYAVLGGGGLNGGVLPVAMVGWVRAGFDATRATGMATTVGLLLGVGVFLAGGGGLTGGTWLERAGETAAAIANGRSAIVAGGGDDDGEWGRTATLGIPRCPTAAERAALHRSCLQDSQKKKV